MLNCSTFTFPLFKLLMKQRNITMPSLSGHFTYSKALHLFFPYNLIFLLPFNQFWAKIARLEIELQISCICYTTSGFGKDSSCFEEYQNRWLIISFNYSNNKGTTVVDDLRRLSSLKISKGERVALRYRNSEKIMKTFVTWIDCSLRIALNISPAV